jgi:hypothetical protein
MRTSDSALVRLLGAAGSRFWSGDVPVGAWVNLDPGSRTGGSVRAILALGFTVSGRGNGRVAHVIAWETGTRPNTVTDPWVPVT